MVPPAAGKRPRKSAKKSAARDPMEEVLKRLERMEERLERIESDAEGPQGDDDTSDAAPASPGPALGWRVLEDPPEPPATAWAQTPSSAGPSARAPASPAPDGPEADPLPVSVDAPVDAVRAPEDPAPRRDVEEMLGADWLAKAGVALVTLGVVFLFQYAVVQGWLTLELQVALGFLFGAALFVVGDVLFVRRRMHLYGQILAGGGAAISYFSVFASYVFPAYRAATGTSLEFTAVLLGLVAFGVLVHAALRHTPVLASMAMVMGAVTVVFAGQWPVFAVVYVLLLTAGVMGVALWRDWEPVAMIALMAALGSLLMGRLFGLEATAAVWAAFGVGVMGLAAGAWRQRDRVAMGVMPATGLVLLVAGFVVPEVVVITAGALALVLAGVCLWRSWSLVAGVGLLGVYVVFLFASLFGYWRFEGALLSQFAVFHLVATGVIAATFTLLTWRLSESVSGAEAQGETRVLGGMGAVAALGAWGLSVLTLEAAGWGAATGWVTLLMSVVLLGLGAVPLAVPALRFAWLISGIVLALAWPPILLSGVPITVVWTAYLFALALVVLQRPSTTARVFLWITAVLVTIYLLVVHWPELLREELGWAPGLAVFGFATVAFVVAWVAEHQQGGEGQQQVSWVLLALALLLPLLYFSSVLEGFLVSVAWAIEALLLVVAGFIAKIRVLRLAGLALFGLVLFRLLVFDMQFVDPGLRIVTFILVGLLALITAYFFARRMRGGESESTPLE